MCILGGQRIDQKARIDMLGEMRKGRRERIEKASRERIEKRERDKKTIRKGGPERPPLFYKYLDPTLRCSHCFFKFSGYDKLELKHKNLVFTSL